MRVMTSFARALATQAAILRFAVWTERETSGFWPFLDRLPAMGFVEIPDRKTPTRVLHAPATCPSTAWEWAIVPTVLGFVCRLWSATLPLAVYGCPR